MLSRRKMCVSRQLGNLWLRYSNRLMKKCWTLYWLFFPSMNWKNLMPSLKIASKIEMPDWVHLITRSGTKPFRSQLNDWLEVPSIIDSSKFRIIFPATNCEINSLAKWQRFSMLAVELTYSGWCLILFDTRPILFIINLCKFCGETQCSFFGWSLSPNYCMSIGSYDDRVGLPRLKLLSRSRDSIKLRSQRFFNFPWSEILLWEDLSNRIP